MSGRALRLSDARFPEALDLALAEQEITSGWITATAVLAEVELRVFDPIAGKPGVRRKIAGRLEAVTLSGPITATENGPLCLLRAVLSRETDTGIETFAGHLAAAHVLSFDGFITSADGSAIDVASQGHARTPIAESPQKPVAKGPWADAAAASDANEDRYDPPPRNQAVNVQTVEVAPMPRPPAKPPQADSDEIYPEAGDLVDHFAFGRCEVVKSDGDRLHVKIPRDGRIKEIALEMLKVSPRDDEGGKKVYKLDRRM